MPSYKRLRRLNWFLTTGAVLACAAAGGVLRAEDAMTPAAADPHAHHRHMMAGSEVRRSMASYQIPRLSMVRDDGKQVSLDKELDDGRPVVVSFIFTTCTTICPMTSQVLSMLQHRLDEEHVDAHLVSISIDPEQDTPARLREFAARFGAGPHWQHYTGTLRASIEAQQAFDVYRGDKSNHSPVTLVRAAPGEPWVRLEGFASPDALLSELQVRQTAAR